MERARVAAAAAEDRGPARALFLHGFVEASRSPREPIPGVEETPAMLIDGDGVAAAVSEVDAARFPERSDDPSWLRDRAMAHERVLETLVQGGGAVPVRFGVVLPGEGAVRDLLRRHAEDIAVELDRVAGAAEWEVRAWCEDERLLASAERGDPALAALAERAEEAEEAEPGAAYLLGRRLQRARAEAVADRARAMGEALLERLAGLARAAEVLPSQSRDPGLTMVLRAAFLVDVAREPTFHDQLAHAASDDLEQGIRVELSGPWPAFHFSRLELREVP